MNQQLPMPDGPWTHEPNEHAFVTAVGLDGLVLRGPCNHLCGYVRVPAGHPWFGAGYDDDRVEVDVHGGVTYADTHRPDKGGTTEWWFGFDCAHHGDYTPHIYGPPRDFEVYRDMAYVVAEVERLASQIVAAVGDTAAQR